MEPNNEVTFKIAGMDCAEEVGVLKREVGPVVGGVENLAFDILNARMVVRVLPQGVKTGAILDAVGRAGLSAKIEGAPGPESIDETSFWPRNRRLILTTISGLALALGMAAQSLVTGRLFAHDLPTPLASKVLYGFAAAIGLWLVFPKALSSLIRKRPDMNLLMTVAVFGAAGIGEWFEGGTVAFLFSLSLLLESWSVNRARRAVAALMDLAPTTVRIVGEKEQVQEVPPEQVLVGALFLVKPGERIPLDGRVARGTSNVNQAPITGESMPVEKTVGSDVYAGTINGDGALHVEVTKLSDDTTLAKIIRLVGEAQSKRGPSEQWVEKFAAIYTPTVMLLALAVFIVPPLLFDASWAAWFYRSLVLLVIACPCALVISTPVSIVAGLTAAARQGVLVKGGEFLEAGAHIKAIAFDKTGTLTTGKPQVVEVVPLAGHTEQELVERAVAMEQHSEHPIARAIVEYGHSRQIMPAPASDFKVIKGKGARAIFDGREFWLGSHRYLEERKQETAEIHTRIEEVAGLGRTVVVVGNDQHVCGLIALSDKARPEAVKALSELSLAGINNLIMLTGDNRPTADAIAKQLGIAEAHAELLPENKVTKIEELVHKYRHVAMVGDGVNDAPALAVATLGIAMGAAGTDAAIETADIALMSDDLSRLPWLIRHSRRVLSIVRQNIALSILVKLAFVLLTFAGISSLWAAIAADMGTSLVVIFNGLRLLNPGTIQRRQ